MNVPFFDLKRQTQSLKHQYLAKLEEVLESTAFTGGPFVDEFENSLQNYLNVKHAIAVNNGTNALHLALLALGIKAGDEVIVPANTFIATAWAPSYVGAIPVFVDCDPLTWNIDPIQLEKAINPKTKLIMPVHLYGQPCNIAAVMEIAKKHNIPVVEDNAQALGATYNGVKVGTMGIISCTSFYPGKNLGSLGEAGAIFTNDDALASKMRILKNHGSEVRYYHTEIGFNMRMTGFQGSMLNIKLQHLNTWNNNRISIANRYKSGFNNPLIHWQKSEENAQSVYHIFVITTVHKEALLAHLTNNNIGYAFHYPVPCHLQTAYKDLNYKVGDFPNAEFLANNCISLPMFPEMTDEEVQLVIEAINSFKLIN